MGSVVSELSSFKLNGKWIFEKTGNFSVLVWLKEGFFENQL